MRFLGRCLFAAALMSLTLAGAAATFPGKNGRISFSQFAEQLPNALNVFTVTPFGTGLTLATPFGPDVFTPFSDFSPDGERLAIETSRSGPNQQIWTISPDGTDARQLTDGPNGVYDPAWTPDGRMLAVDSDFGSARASS